MDTSTFLAVISSYGTISDPSHHYKGAIMFSEKERFLNLLADYLIAQAHKAEEDEEIMEELEEIDLHKAENQIKDGIEELKADLDAILNNEGIERRLVLSVPELLTDWHIEIFGPENKDAFPVKDNKIAVLACDRDEGCGPGGEFLEVVQLVSPEEEEDFDINYELNVFSADPFDSMNGIEKWNSLVGEGGVIEVIS